jgi:hypothetical protein
MGSCLQGFEPESLVLTDAPCETQMRSFKAEFNLKFCNDLDEALQKACVESKQVLLIVVGSYGCPWSEKLLFDVIYKPEFYLAAQQKFVFCKLDITSPCVKAEGLGLDHPLDKVPVLIMMTKQGEVIAEKLDLPETPLEMITYLNQASRAQESIEQILATSQNLKEDELESSYKLAKEFGLTAQGKIYQMGLLKKKNIFFLLQRYQKLLSSGSSKEVKDLRLDIERLDPRNTKGAIRSLAILDFEARALQKKGIDNPFAALKPLFEYLKDYGHYDKECRWEIEMRIARFLFAKNQLQAALEHASRSLEWAPESKRSEVSETVDFLKKHIKQIR